MSRTYGHKPHCWWKWRAGIPSWFKRLNRREERRKANEAVRIGEDPPRIRKRDAHDWW